LPTGNVDLAPTIARVLGITSPEQMDGRILTEAMVDIGRDATAPKGGTKTIEATKDFRSGTWRQRLKISQIGSTIYLDEGNGSFAPKVGGSSD